MSCNCRTARRGRENSERRQRIIRDHKKAVHTIGMKQTLAKLFLVFLGLWLVAWNTFLTIASSGNPVSLAIMKMSWGLALVWILLCGTLLYKNRKIMRTWVQRIPLPWQVTFVLFATVLALTEEAITVSLTNMAPLFGAPLGEAYITASTNYFDVVLFHSVIVFIPLFVAWAILLSKYDFKPFAVFVLFGVTGIFAEISLGGPMQLFGFAQWIFVYGLMVYLPTYCLPARANLKPVYFYHYLLAIPTTFFMALPLLLPIVFIISSVLAHPSIHFVQ